MKLKVMTTIFALVLIAGSVALALSLSTGAASVSASEARNGQLHIVKDCTSNTGLPGGYCTVVTSNLAEIPVPSYIFYDQAAGTPAGLLDSNIVLDAGSGNRAVGRCTLDLSKGLGLCTCSDGTGQLAGFTARVNVSHLGGKMWAWDGTYSYSPLPPR
jgi:hypothetical protein